MPKEKVYMFRGINGLYCDTKGNFFFHSHPVPKIYNNGSLAVRVGKTKYGIKKLGGLASISSKEVQELPF
jgi:hypothetical protein